MTDTTEAALNDLIAVSMNDRMIINHAGIIQAAVEVIRSALAAARTENERLGADMPPCDGGCDYNSGPEETCSLHGRPVAEVWQIAQHFAAERDEARVALAEANRKWDEMLMDNDPTASLIRDLAATEPEPLGLDPEPWLCTWGGCPHRRPHREAEWDRYRTLKPREEYEQDLTRYDEEIER